MAWPGASAAPSHVRKEKGWLVLTLPLYYIERTLTVGGIAIEQDTARQH